MDLSVPAAALLPFMDSEVLVVPHTRAAEIANPVRIRACVRETSPLAAGGEIGRDASSNDWCVSIRWCDIPSGVEIVRGAVILPNRSASRPRLMVKKVSQNGNVLHLECSARERG